MPNFTTEDLLLFLYHELNAEEASNIEEALQTDWALQQKYGVLQEAQAKLNKAVLTAPRRQTMDAILQYAAMKVPAAN